MKKIIEFSLININPIQNFIKFTSIKLANFKKLWEILRKSDVRFVIV